ncbi:MAG: hypothetical protein QM755_03225 [Luteolibacter sp.]
MTSPLPIPEPISESKLYFQPRGRLWLARGVLVLGILLLIAAQVLPCRMKFDKPYSTVPVTFKLEPEYVWKDLAMPFLKGVFGSLSNLLRYPKWFLRALVPILVGLLVLAFFYAAPWLTWFLGRIGAMRWVLGIMIIGLGGLLAHYSVLAPVHPSEAGPSLRDRCLVWRRGVPRRGHRRVDDPLGEEALGAAAGGRDCGVKRVTIAVRETHHRITPDTCGEFE